MNHAYGNAIQSALVRSLPEQIQTRVKLARLNTHRSARFPLSLALCELQHLQSMEPFFNNRFSSRPEPSPLVLWGLIDCANAAISSATIEPHTLAKEATDFESKPEMFAFRAARRTQPNSAEAMAAFTSGARSLPEVVEERSSRGIRRQGPDRVQPADQIRWHSSRSRQANHSGAPLNRR